MDANKQLAELRKSNKQRKFIQSVDLSVNFSADKKKLNVSGTIVLPHGKGKAGKVCIFTDSMAEQAKSLGLDVITRRDMAAMDAATSKSLPDKYDSFFAESTLMLDIGKKLGPILAPKGKMPKPFQPGADVKTLISSGQNSFPVSIKTNVLHLTIGREDFSDKQILENVESVINFLIKNLPKGKNQIKSAYMKFSMSPTVRLM